MPAADCKRFPEQANVESRVAEEPMSVGQQILGGLLVTDAIGPLSLQTGAAPVSPCNVAHLVTFCAAQPRQFCKFPSCARLVAGGRGLEQISTGRMVQ